MSDRPEFDHPARPSTAQPAPVPAGPDAVSIHDLAIADAEKYGWTRTAALLAERKAFGLAKYGTVLHADDQRDSLSDAVEEYGDAFAYLKKAIVAAGRGDVIGQYIITGGVVENLLAKLYPEAEEAAA